MFAPIDVPLAVCLALHLNSYQGNMMLLLAGYTLKNTKTDCMYRFFIDFAFKETVLECNNALIRCGLKPLTKSVTRLFSNPKMYVAVKSVIIRV